MNLHTQTAVESLVSPGVLSRNKRCVLYDNFKKSKQPNAGKYHCSEGRPRYRQRNLGTELKKNDPIVGHRRPTSWVQFQPWPVKAPIFHTILCTFVDTRQELFQDRGESQTTQIGRIIMECRLYVESVVWLMRTTRFY